MPQDKAIETLPQTSRRAQLAERANFAGDVAGEAAITKLMGLVIGFLFINLIAVLLYTNIGIDSTEICNDTTNFTTEDCDQAKAQRGWFWTILVIVDVVILLLLLTIARKEAKF